MSISFLLNLGSLFFLVFLGCQQEGIPNLIDLNDLKIGCKYARVRVKVVDGKIRNGSFILAFLQTVD